MATISSREMVEEIIVNLGLYPGDESSPLGRIIRIVEYDTPEGDTVWGLVYEAERSMGLLHRYDLPTGVILNPRVIFAIYQMAEFTNMLGMPENKPVVTLTRGMYTVTKICPLCEKPATVENIPEEAYDQWKKGAFIQVALWMLSAADREILLSGTHDACYQILFPPDDEDDGPPEWSATNLT